MKHQYIADYKTMKRKLNKETSVLARFGFRYALCATAVSVVPIVYGTAGLLAGVAGGIGTGAVVVGAASTATNAAFACIFSVPLSTHDYFKHLRALKEWRKYADVQHKEKNKQERRNRRR